jgi:tRNA U34 5-methylaminomethyl-2-thiouridine-forming methyltransferase MnmC
MLERTIITTLEGTKTIHIPEWNETYHSRHGIMQEAEHVFISHGLDQIKTSEISILEMGFGTGLNAFLTLFKAMEKDLTVQYYTLEKYPLNKEEINELQYGALVDNKKAEEYYQVLHQADWEQEIRICENFTFTKFKADFLELRNLPINDINLIYFDAFGSRVQPELWVEDIFKQIFDCMVPGGLLTTYSSKGSARRAMQSVGFKVEKLSGPQGKREMVNAWKR